MDFFLIHVLNLFFPFVKILFQSSWNVLHFYWLFYAQFCVIIFISSCLCCVSPFLSHHVRLYLRFYSFIYLFMSMLHFTIFVMLCLCCVFYRFCGVTGIPASIARREPELYFSCIRVSVDHGFFQRTLIYLSLYDTIKNYMCIKRGTERVVPLLFIEGDEILRNNQNIHAVLLSKTIWRVESRLYQKLWIYFDFH